MIAGRVNNMTVNASQGLVVIEVHGWAEGTEVLLQQVIAPGAALGHAHQIIRAAEREPLRRTMTAVLLSRGHSDTDVRSILNDLELLVEPK